MGRCVTNGHRHLDPITYLVRKDSFMTQLTDVEFDVVSFGNAQQVNAVKALVWEYFQWGNGLALPLCGIEFDIKRMFERFVDGLEKYEPPEGILYLVRHNGEWVGTGGLKRVADDVCELKRMYLKESSRQKGIGTRLLSRLMEDAKRQGYRTINLESARYMTAAYEMYRKFGFEEIPIYEQAESDPQHRKLIYCMSRSIR